jgi:hypothetical protein
MNLESVNAVQAEGLSTLKRMKVELTKQRDENNPTPPLTLDLITNAKK